MNHEELNSVMRQSLRQQAQDAPVPEGLLDSVKTRSRRRAKRDVTLAGLATVVLIAGGAVGFTGLPGPEPSTEALFGTEEVAVCFDLDDDGRPSGVVLTEVTESEVDSNEGHAAGGTVDLQHTVRGGQFSVTVEIGPGPASAAELSDKRGVDIGGRGGFLGEDAQGERVLVFDTDVADTAIELRPEQPLPSDEQLITWAQTFRIHTDDAACSP